MGSVNLDQGNDVTLRTLLASCLGIATVEGSSPTAQLAKFTRQKCLSCDPALFDSPLSKLSTSA